ncbi:MAG: Ger(x)C family spore germination protein [Bacillota bacterium]
MHKTFLAFICISFIFLTGCWDAVDIEERAYIIGVAIDEYPSVPKGQEEETKEVETEQEKVLETDTEVDTGRPMYAMTIQMPIIKMGTHPNIQGGGGGGAEPDVPRTWELTQTGNSFIEINRTIATRTNFKPYYEHLQVIIISDKVARKGLKNILDFFIRDPEMRSRTKVFITDGDAKKVLDVIPRIEDYASIYLAKTVSNARINSQMIHWTDLGKAVQNIYTGVDFPLPHVKVSGDEVMNKGAAIFKGDKMVGWIDGSDIETGKLIRNIYIGGITTARMPGTKNSIMALEVVKSKTKVTPVIQGNEVSFKIDIDIKGNYVESVNSTFLREIDQDFIQQASKAFEDSIKNRCLGTVEKLQNKFGADIFHFSNVLKTQKPEYWKKVKDRWHDIFPYVKVDIKVNVDIKQVGNIR